ncbi:hypothetical protein Q8A73_009528 [Channa argus]|nr:hypothetical protein Q8A73_009528 [Channa argus]
MNNNSVTPSYFEFTLFSDYAVINVAGQFLAVISTFIPLSFVLYTYLRILIVCRRILIEVSLSQYKTDEVNTVVIVVLSLEFLIIPPISNPVVYGLKLPQSRRVEHELAQIPQSSSFSEDATFTRHDVGELKAVEFLFIPPISNPLVYGLNLPQIRGVIVTSVKIQ